MKISKRTAAVKKWIERKPGAVPELFSARRGAAPIAVIYKVMGKIFAILSIRTIENVILKSDPHLAQMLRRQYAGVGHRSHLDRRYWISVTLDADVPPQGGEALGIAVVRLGMRQAYRETEDRTCEPWQRWSSGRSPVSQAALTDRCRLGSRSAS